MKHETQKRENYKPYQENKESSSSIKTPPKCGEYKISEKMEKNLKLLVELDELILKKRKQRDMS